MATYDQGQAPSQTGARGQGFVNVVGALVSLSLIIGVAYWGYGLIMRDVSGIPVVRAMEGDMRVLPADPGGDVARHAGLAINELVAQGEAAGPEDRLVLAPVTAGLAQEDMAAPVVATPTDQILIPPAVLPGTPEAAASQTATVDDVLAMVADITAADEAQEIAAMDRVPASVAGVSVSLRPVLRPASLRANAPAAAQPTPAAAAAPPVTEVAITTTEFPAGTDLVQLGAFSSAELAASEWARLQSRFGSLMNGRNRVVQVSTQSSGTWYRLRASGFADRDDARRFCAALQAEGAECIAVVVN